MAIALGAYVARNRPTAPPRPFQLTMNTPNAVPSTRVAMAKYSPLKRNIGTLTRSAKTPATRPPPMMSSGTPKLKLLASTADVYMPMPTEAAGASETRPP